MRAIAFLRFLSFAVAAAWFAPAGAQPTPARRAPTGPPAAAVAKEEEPAPAATEEGKGDERPSQHARSLTRIRTGSMLRRPGPEDAVVDLRGELERRRDLEVIRHFTRLAQLDVIDKVASEMGDPQLASEVDAVRRSELERFRRAMLHLQRVSRGRLQAGLP